MATVINAIKWVKWANTLFWIVCIKHLHFVTAVFRLHINNWAGILFTITLLGKIGIFMTPSKSWLIIMKNWKILCTEFYKLMYSKDILSVGKVGASLWNAFQKRTKSAMHFCRNLLLSSWMVADPSHRNLKVNNFQMHVSEYNQQPNCNNYEDRCYLNILSNCWFQTLSYRNSFSPLSFCIALSAVSSCLYLDMCFCAGNLSYSSEPPGKPWGCDKHWGCWLSLLY